MDADPLKNVASKYHRRVFSLYPPTSEGLDWSYGPAGRGRLGLSKAKEKAFGFSASFTQSIPSKLTFFLIQREGPTPSLPPLYYVTRTALLWFGMRDFRFPPGSNLLLLV